MFPSNNTPSIQTLSWRWVPIGRMHQRCQLWPLAPTPQTTTRQGSWVAAKKPKAGATPTPSPSPDHGFESNRSLVSMASSVSSQSDRSEGSQLSIMADIAGRLEATWISIYPSLKMRTPSTLSPNTVGDGTWLYTIMQGVEIIPFSPTLSEPCKGITESLWGAPGWT